MKEGSVSFDYIYCHFVSISASMDGSKLRVKSGEIAALDLYKDFLYCVQVIEIR